MLSLAIVSCTPEHEHHILRSSFGVLMAWKITTARPAPPGECPPGGVVLSQEET